MNKTLTETCRWRWDMNYDWMDLIMISPNFDPSENNHDGHSCNRGGEVRHELWLDGLNKKITTTYWIEWWRRELWLHGPNDGWLSISQPNPSNKNHGVLDEEVKTLDEAFMTWTVCMPWLYCCFHIPTKKKIIIRPLAV